AAAAPRRGRRPFLDRPLPPLEEDVIELGDLARFARRPVADFLRRRLGMRFEERRDESVDSLPIELHPLDRHGVGERILAARMAGLPMSVCVAAERARGSLPPGTLADELIESTVELVETLLRACAQAVDLDAPRRTLDVRLELGSGTMLVGSVAGVYGEVACSLGYSRISGGRRLESWIRLLALSASQHRLRSAVTVGRSAPGADPGGSGVTVAELSAPPDPTGALEELVDLYRRGMREPLPLYAKTSEAWAAARRRGRVVAPAGAAGSSGRRARQDGAGAEPPDPQRWAGNAWRPRRSAGGGRGIPPEGDENAHLLVLGRVTLSELLAQAPRADESGPGWAAEETTRLGRYARRLWDPLLACERLEER
ncbi:MAG TPA: hypothetical protein VMD59_18850, partial [Acidimicrobiales bacterium]|nr:hypothetical protein [Acidimicrobiales bacterium]